MKDNISKINKILKSEKLIQICLGEFQIILNFTNSCSLSLEPNEGYQQDQIGSFLGEVFVELQVDVDAITIVFESNEVKIPVEQVKKGYELLQLSSSKSNLIVIHKE